MKTAFRITLAIIAFFATYFFIYWVPFSLITGLRTTQWLPTVGSMLIAVLGAVFVWKRTGNVSNNFASCVLLGGIIIGGISFLCGFLGPIFLTPDNNLGPLLGIFFTGPIGFVAGLLAGAVYWFIRHKKRNFPNTQL